MFATLLELGRVDFLYAPGQEMYDTGCTFVIANLNLSFLKKINWRGFRR